MEEPTVKPVCRVAKVVIIIIVVFIFTATIVVTVEPAEGKGAAQAARSRQHQTDNHGFYDLAHSESLGVEPIYQVGSLYGITSTISSIQTVANSAPTIDIWYGPTQNFGQIGNPQQWVNILGNVSDPDGIKTLVYSLNNGSPLTLTVGPDGRRLESNGDFNIDIDQANLLVGNNQVIITATDNLNTQANKIVTINHAANSVWPLPYAINWSGVSKIQAVAQVVDGLWSVSPAGVRTVIPGYDRLVAIGSIPWTDYEVVVPITVHSVNLGGNAPGVGILMRWEGHTDYPIICLQPKCGYIPNGNIGWFRFYDGNFVRLEFFDPAKNQVFPFVIGTKYWFKIKVETLANQVSQYSLKAWADGQAEPSNWILDVQEHPDNQPMGSFLLIAHHADATFGNLSVVPVNGNLLTVNIAGSGEVMLDPAGGEYGEGTVVTLKAQPDSGWAFTGWNGDLTGTTNPAQLTMDGDKNVTATFTQGYSVNVNVVGQGSVDIVPEGPYFFGDMVTLAAIPEPSWSFSGWTGDINGNANPVNRTITGNLNVTALFSMQHQVLLPVLEKP